jgi:predicted metal-binding membrane protein
MKSLFQCDQKGALTDSRGWAPVIWPWVLVIAAWTVALLAVLTKQAYLINHNYLLTQSHLSWIAALVVFLASWQVMTVAMMLPSSIPLVNLIVHTSRRQRHPWATQAAFLAGYAVVWTAFAFVAFLADTLVHRLVNNWFWLYLHSWLISATVFAIAGAFQFSSLKKHCLKQCRNPQSFFTYYYQKGVVASWHLGLRHGMFCLGCCWALMLVMFGVGVGSIVWMAVLTGIMVIEKTYPGGQRLRLLFGIVLLLLSALWLVHSAWLLAGSGV